MSNFWKEIKKPIIGLSPMDGVTDYPMRQIQCFIAKPDVLYTEFISAEGFTQNPEHFIKTLTFAEIERPIVAQIFGYTPEAFYETVLQVGTLGFDGIDINMGCPSRKVLGKGGGGALIGNYKLAEELINSCLRALSEIKKEIPLSVKTRIGIKDIITDDWINFLSDFPLAEVTVHGRLLKNCHSGQVLWDEIRDAARILKNKNIVCLGNGGIKSINDAQNICHDYGLDGVLIGQAALGNPWVFKENYTPTENEIKEIILKHAKFVEDFYEAKKFVTVLKHFGWYPRGFDNCKKLKIELLKTRNLDQVEQILANFR